jgi:hypothetical protein
MEPVTVKLHHPILDFGKPVSELTIARACTFGDYMDADEAGEGAHQRLGFFVHRLCGVTMLAVRQLHPEDMEHVAAAIAPFVAGGPPTGSGQVAS